MGFISKRLNVSGANQLNIPLAQNGFIYLYDIKLNKPFKGNYFDNAIISLSAHPKEGYRFVKWSNGMTSPKIDVTMNASIKLEAIFEKK